MNKEPVVTVYAICKNEEENIYDFLQNIYFSSTHKETHPDHIILCDTGSIDNTLVKIEESIKALEIPRDVVKVYTFHYDNFRFDEARNDSFKKVPEDTDMAICIDLDERMHPDFIYDVKQCLKDFPKTQQILYKYAWSVDKTVDPPKPIKIYTYNKVHKIKDFRWTHACHEGVEYIGETEPNVHMLDDNKIYVWHYPKTKDRSFYLNLIAKRLEEEPEEISSYYFLGREYFNIEDTLNAIKYLSVGCVVCDRTIKGFKKNDVPDVFKKETLFMASIMYTMLAQMYWIEGLVDIAKKFFERAQLLSPKNKEAYITEAFMLSHGPNAKEALEVLEKVPKTPIIEDWRIKEYLWTEWCERYTRMDAYITLKRYDEAFEEAKKFLSSLKTPNDKLEAMRIGAFEDLDLLNEELSKQGKEVIIY